MVTDELRRAGGELAAAYIQHVHPGLCAGVFLCLGFCAWGFWPKPVESTTGAVTTGFGE